MQFRIDSSEKLEIFEIYQSVSVVFSTCRMCFCFRAGLADVELGKSAIV